MMRKPLAVRVMRQLVLLPLVTLILARAWAAMPLPTYQIQPSVINASGGTMTGDSMYLINSIGEPAIGQSGNFRNIYSAQLGFFNEYFILPSTPTITPTVTPTTTAIRTFDGELLSKEWVYAAPNPIRGLRGNIVFDLAGSAEVDLKVLTSQGQLVISRHWDNLPAGQNRWEWNTSNISNGVYFLLIKASGGGKTTTIKKKIALIR